MLSQKRQILKNKIQRGEVKGFTIAGNLTHKAALAYKNDNLMNYFKELGIEFENIGGLEYTDAAISIYIPRDSKTIQFFTLKINNNKIYSTLEAAEKLFYDIFDYYEVALSPFVMEAIISGESLSLNDLLIHTCLQQKEISARTNVDYKFLNNLLNAKRDMSIDTFKKIYNEFPLLPWELFLK